MQEKDRTDDIRAVVEKYPDSPFEFIPLRLENSFDPAWWKMVGKSTPAERVQVDMTDEGLYQQSAGVFKCRS